MNHSPGFLKLVEDAKKTIRECTVEEVKTKQEKGEVLFLVDVREDREFLQAHAADATHLGKGIIERDIEQAVPDKEAQLVLYCGGGFRSALAAEALQKMGYSNVLSLEGGFRAWLQAGLPVDAK